MTPHETFGMHPADTSENDAAPSKKRYDKFVEALEPESGALVKKIDALEDSGVRTMNEHQEAARIAEEEAVKLRYAAMEQHFAKQDQKAVADVAERIARRAAWDHMSAEQQDAYVQEIVDRIPENLRPVDANHAFLHELHAFDSGIKELLAHLERHPELEGRFFQAGTRGTETVR